MDDKEFTEYVASLGGDEHIRAERLKAEKIRQIEAEFDADYQQFMNSHKRGGQMGQNMHVAASGESGCLETDTSTLDAGKPVVVNGSGKYGGVLVDDLKNILDRVDPDNHQSMSIQNKDILKGAERSGAHEQGIPCDSARPSAVAERLETGDNFPDIINRPAHQHTDIQPNNELAALAASGSVLRTGKAPDAAGAVRYDLSIPVLDVLEKGQCFPLDVLDSGDPISTVDDHSQTFQNEGPESQKGQRFPLDVSDSGSGIAKKPTFSFRRFRLSGGSSKIPSSETIAYFNWLKNADPRMFSVRKHGPVDYYLSGKDESDLTGIEARLDGAWEANRAKRKWDLDLAKVMAIMIYKVCRHGDGSLGETEIASRLLGRPFDPEDKEMTALQRKVCRTMQVFCRTADNPEPECPIFQEHNLKTALRTIQRGNRWTPKCWRLIENA